MCFFFILIFFFLNSYLPRRSPLFDKTVMPFVKAIGSCFFDLIYAKNPSKHALAKPKQKRGEKNTNENQNKCQYQYGRPAAIIALPFKDN